MSFLKNLWMVCFYGLIAFFTGFGIYNFYLVLGWNNLPSLFFGIFGGSIVGFMFGKVEE